MKFYYEREYFTKALSESSSIRDLIFRLVGRHGTLSYDTVKKYISKYDLNDGHFTGQGWNKGRTADDHPSIAATAKKSSFSPNEALVNGIRLSSATLHRLLKAIGRKRVCVKCGVGEEWQGERLALQVDHKDGDSYNNLAENLRLMCPNCHSQTPTFCSRNRKIRNIDFVREELRKPKRIKPKTNSCKVCGGPAGRSATYCSQKCRGVDMRGICQPRTVRIDLPEIDEQSVLNALKECKYNLSATGRRLKISRTSVRNFLYEHELYNLVEEYRNADG